MGIIANISTIYLILLLYLPTGADSLQAYDCTDPNTQYTEISLKEVGPCSAIGNNYQDPELQEIQVIKKIRAKNFHSLWCRVKVDIETLHCGHDGLYSYTYPGPKISTNEIAEVTKVECERAHLTGRLKVNLDNSNSIEIKLSQTKHASQTLELKGSVEKDASCEGVDFKFRNKKYTNSLLRLRYLAEIGKIHAIYDADTKKIIIPNKIQAEADPLFVSDAVHGTYTWNKDDLTKVTQCDDFQEVIKGSARVYNPTNGSSEYESIVLLEDTERGRHAALMKGDPVGACGKVVYSTQLEDIFINVLREEKSELHIKKINHLNTDKFINLEGLISLTHLSSEIRTNEAFSKITTTICETNRLRLQESVNNFAKSGVGLSNRPEGTISVKAGSTAYLFKCAAVNVDLRFGEHNFCTHEIPVWFDGPDGRVATYADPVTLVLVSNATRTVCNSISPVKWALPHRSGTGFEWYCSIPSVTRCDEPKVLDPMLIKNPVFNVKSQDLKMSFFDKTQLQSLSKFQNMANVRNAITNKLTHDVMSNSDSQDPGYNIFQGIPEKELQHLREKLTPFSTILGKIWKMCGNFIIAFFVIKMIFRLVLLLSRMHRMIQIKGFSSKILYAFVTELFLATINSASHNCCPCKEFNIEELKQKLREIDTSQQEAE